MFSCTRRSSSSAGSGLPPRPGTRCVAPVKPGVISWRPPAHRLVCWAMIPMRLVETDREGFDEPVVELWRDDEFVGMVFWDGDTAVRPDLRRRRRRRQGPRRAGVDAGARHRRVDRVALRRSTTRWTRTRRRRLGGRGPVDGDAGRGVRRSRPAPHRGGRGVLRLGRRRRPGASLRPTRPRRAGAGGFRAGRRASWSRSPSRSCSPRSTARCRGAGSGRPPTPGPPTRCSTGTTRRTRVFAFVIGLPGGDSFVA